MWFKKIINVLVSLSLLQSQAHIAMVGAMFVSASVLNAEVIVDTSTDTNPPVESDGQESVLVDEVTPTLNAQCLIYFDVLQSDTCKQYWLDAGSDNIEDLQNSGDAQVFESCLKTNCGSYPTAGISQEQTYPYIMETVKGCTLDSERTVSGSGLNVTEWLKADSSDENNISTTQTSTKTIPYKLLQYSCPSYSEDVCVASERVMQSPVMCFTSGISIDLQNAIKNCLSGDTSACDNVNNSGGIGNFVFWQYCDADNDGDGYYESLSPETQVACNRSDASLLRCDRDKACTLVASCENESNVTKTTTTMRKCNDIGRNFEEHIVNTQCGDQTDQYKEDADCIRINSISDALQDNIIKIGFISGAGTKTDDYTEFVIYKKKENFQHEEILAAMFFPWSLDKTTSGYYILDVSVEDILAVLAVATVGFDLATAATAAVVSYFGLSDSMENDGLSTVLDDLYRKTREYCSVADNNCSIVLQQDMKNWDWKTGRIIEKKYNRAIAQSAIWTEPFVQNMQIDDFEWEMGPSRELKWVPTRINYSMKLNLSPSDILVIYNTNTRENTQSYIGTKINTYTDIPSCETEGISPINQYKDIIEPVGLTIAPETEIHDVAMILPHAGIYSFKLYDNDTYVDTFVKFFPMNNGSNYPLSGADLLSTNLDYESFSDTVLTNIQNKIPDLVQSKIDEKELFINSIVNDILRITQEGNKYKLDNNLQIDYLNDLNDSNASLIYSLLEEDYLEELKKNDSPNLLTDDGGDFTNFPEKIDSDVILQFEEVAGALVENPDNIQDQYAVGRYGEITDQRTKPAFLSELQIRLNDFIAPLDTQRLEKVIEYTNDVYSDYEEVKDKVSSYLNKSGTRYSTSTEYGSYSASFKSSCGDYNDALLNVDSQYDATKSLIGGGFFQQDLDLVKEGVKGIITGHLDDQTIQYKYYKNTRSGSSKYDNYHSAISGSYSCSYDCNVYSSCASTTPIVCDEDGENCTGGDCVSGYVWTIDGCVESGSCQTFGDTGTSCTAQCDGYHVPYYGSLYDDSGDADNDWDNSCTGTYEWYTTNDNNGIGGSKTISGVNMSDYFGSWGAYSCDNLSISSTGTSQTKCIYNKHDQVDDYTNTIPDSALSWSSISKKLDTNTDAVETELISWMEENNFKDSSDSSPYFTGNDNVRYNLAYDSPNGINTESDNYIVPIIRGKVVDLYKNYLTNYYNNLLKNNLSQVNADLTNLIKTEYESYYNAYFSNNWHKFNRIVIEDADVRLEDANSVNFDITLPGGHYVKNPNAFSITIAPHYEIRKYRCYTDWKTCDIPDNCTPSTENIINYITDSDNKSVPTVKDVTFKCDSQNTISVCSSLKITKQCSDLNMTMPHIEYDDTDFSEDFYSNIGKTMAINESIKIFGAKPLTCEEGLFVDLSWAEDPMYYLSAMNMTTLLISEVSEFSKSMNAWMSNGNYDAIQSSDSTMCEQSFADCLNSSGFTSVQMAAGMITDGDEEYDISAFNQAEEACIQATGYDNGCVEWEDQYRGSKASVAESITTSNAGYTAAEMATVPITVLYGPVAGFIARTITNLIFNTFDSCSQCVNTECAEAYEPREAKDLIKMTNGLMIATKFTGSEYGLGADFVAYNNCFYQKSGCAQRFLNSCIRDYKTFCCYNDRMSRILAGQIYQQLGYTYEANGCSAIGIEDLSRIDFSMCTAGVVPSPSNRCLNYKEIEEYMMSQVNWDTQKSFDVNTVIQTSVNAAKMMN